MERMRTAIVTGRFPQFCREFVRKLHGDGNYPQWAVDALASVNITMDSTPEDSTKEDAGGFAVEGGEMNLTLSVARTMGDGGGVWEWFLF